ncbi:NUDIX domain-containing protein [Streptomyces sp. NPDC051018]|uniref:NUDIX domain-containing protein n=1 Tax=Streptomyces sp. NPDC051018 TaxID=3365639 RepID=UPI0037A3E026
MEPGESPRAAALRELLEETGQRPDGPCASWGTRASCWSPADAPSTARCSPAVPPPRRLPARRRDRRPSPAGPPPASSGPRPAARHLCRPAAHPGTRAGRPGRCSGGTPYRRRCHWWCRCRCRPRRTEGAEPGHAVHMTPYR